MRNLNALIQTPERMFYYVCVAIIAAILSVVFSSSAKAAANTWTWNGYGVTTGTSGTYWDSTANYSGTPVFTSSNSLDFTSITSSSVTLSSTTIGTISVSNLIFGTTSATTTTPTYLTLNGTGTAGQTVLSLSGGIYMPTVTGSKVVLGSDLTLGLSNAVHYIRQSAAYGALVVNSKVTGGGSSAQLNIVSGNTAQIILANNSNDFDASVYVNGGGVYYTSINNTGSAAGTSALGTAVNSSGLIYLWGGGIFDYIGSGDQTTNRTISVGTTSIIGNFATTASTLTLSSVTSAATNVGTYSFAVSGSNSIVVTAVLSNSTATGNYAMGLTKTSGKTYYTADGTYTTGNGNGTLILTGANTYTGATTVGAGTLQIGDGTTGSLNGTTGTTLIMAGGKFVVNEASGVSQGMSTLTVSMADNTIQSINNGGNSYLTFSAVGTKGAGATANFITTNGTNGTSNEIVLTGQSTGAMGAAYFYGGSNYAWYDASGYVRGINYGVDSGTAASTGGTSVASTTNLLVTGNVTAEATGNTFSTIELNGTPNFTLASAATVSVSGLLKSGGGTSTISGGSGIMSAVNGGEMVFRVDSSTDVLAIASSIKANGTTALVKSGDGTLVLAGSNVFSGSIYINDGTLQVTNTGGLPNGYSLLLNGGTFQWSAGTGTGTTVSNRSVALGADSIIQIDSGVNDLCFSSTTNLSNNGNNTLTVTGGGNLSFGSATTLTANIYGVGSLVKNGTGTLSLYGSSNTYSGTTTVNNGTMKVYGAITSTSGVIVNGGTFDYRNSSTALDRNVTVSGGTFKNNGATFSGLLTFKSGTLGGTNFTGVNLTGDNAIGSGKALAPGDSTTGTMTVGNVDFINGGIYQWEINSLTGTAGGTTGWDLISGSGSTLNLSEISTHFTLQIDSLNALTGWDSKSDYSWTVATFSSITDFKASDFYVDTTGFNENAFTGTFSVTSDGTNLYLNYTAVPEPTTWAMCVLALCVLAGWRRIKTEQNS